MSNFEWETEEEDRSPSRSPRHLPSHNRRRLIIAAAVFIALLAAAVGITIRLKDQAEIQEKQVKVDIISVYEIWRDAVAQSDRELLNTIIVGDDPRWTAAQRKLLESGLLLQRTGFGFDTAAPISLPDQPTIVVSDDWRNADLFFNQEYTPASGRSERFELTHTVAFRREGSRWLHSHAAESFWGEPLSLSLENLTASYPERDRHITERIANDLNQDLSQICQRLFQAPCPKDSHIEIVFDADPAVLLKVSDPDLPSYQGKAFTLPTPTLLGTPTSEESYDRIYDAYAEPIKLAYEAGLISPSPMPEQTLQLLCYSDFGAKPRLFGYDPSENAWSIDMPERSFQFLSSLANDDGLLLQEYPSSAGGTSLSLVSWTDNDRQHLFDYGMSLVQAFPAGDYTEASQPDILMRTISSQPENINFNLINGSLCSDEGCQMTELDGFPVWSPNERNTLLWQGGTVYLGDKNGTAHTVLTEGFSPFWIDDRYFGLAQFGKIEGRSEVVLYYADIDNQEMSTLITSSQLADYIELSDASSFFIQLAVPRPQISNEFIILAREYAGEESRFFLFSVKILENEGEIHLQQIQELASIRGVPGSYPSSTTPTGQIPFVFSSDGSYITIGRKADSDIHYWELTIISIDKGKQYTIETTYPAHTFLHPYLDWSFDGKWLAIIDDGYLKLISPEDEFRRLFPYDMQS